MYNVSRRLCRARPELGLPNRSTLFVAFVCIIIYFDFSLFSVYYRFLTYSILYDCFWDFLHYFHCLEMLKQACTRVFLR